MRYPASKKLDIIRLVEESGLPVKRTLEKLRISRSMLYRWHDLSRRFGAVGWKTVVRHLAGSGTEYRTWSGVS